jgi:hypothetical protein
MIQKNFQKEEKLKGNTVMIFDREFLEEQAFCIFNPPTWTDYYYDKRKKQERMDQIVDVPNFGDSEHVHLLQVADLITYFLRLYLEIIRGNTTEAYSGELHFLETFVLKIKAMALPTSTRYPSRGRDECTELFYHVAPKEIVRL